MTTLAYNRPPTTRGSRGKVVKDVSWKHVAIILGFFATIAALTFTDKDTATFILVGMGILGGIGVVAVKSAETKEQSSAVQQQTDGNMTKLLEMLEAQGRMLAQMQPPARDEEKLL